MKDPWAQLGKHTWGYVVDGRIVALAFWRDGLLLIDGEGKPVATDPAWRWVPVDDAGCEQLIHDAPLLPPDDASLERIAQARDAALGVAEREIIAYLGRA